MKTRKDGAAGRRRSRSHGWLSLVAIVVVVGMLASATATVSSAVGEMVRHLRRTQQLYEWSDELMRRTIAKDLEARIQAAVGSGLSVADFQKLIGPVHLLAGRSRPIGGEDADYTHVHFNWLCCKRYYLAFRDERLVAYRREGISAGSGPPVGPEHALRKPSRDKPSPGTDSP